MSSYSKGKIAEQFAEQYKQLGEKQKETFSYICFKLLNENYIFGQKEDEKDLYYNIDLFKDILQNYFNLIDYELASDKVYKIFYLKSSRERISLKLKKLDSIILLLLRKFYYTKSKETNSDINIAITYDELLEDINKTAIYKERLKKTEILTSLKNLKRYKIINFEHKFYSTSDALTIYPTILYAVTETDLNNIQVILREYGSKEEDLIDEIDEG